MDNLGWIEFIGGDIVTDGYLSAADRESIEYFGLDAFGRSRVSATGQRLDVEFLYNKQDEYADEITSNGTVTHNANTRDLTLSISDTSNGTRAKIATYPVPYTPGNSQLVEITGVLNLAALSGGSVEFFLRSSISGSAADIYTVQQSDWLNFKTSSDIDFTKAQIFYMDFQSLKVGKIRAGISKQGIIYPVCNLLNANIRNSGYWQLANGSAFWDVHNVAGETHIEFGYGNDANAIGFRFKVAANASATAKAICATVKSEGGNDLLEMAGLPRYVDTGTTGLTVSSTLIPLISIRPGATYETFENLILCLPKVYEVVTDNPIRIVLLHDATLTGASFTAVNGSESCMEYDTTATAVSGGHVVAGGPVATAAKNAGISKAGLLGKTLLWARNNPNHGILTLAAQKTGTTDAEVFPQISWEELR